MYSREKGNLVNNCQIRQLYDETPASAGVNMSGAASDGKTVKIHFRVEAYFDPVFLETSRDSS
jgi:hypothetical protein